MLGTPFGGFLPLILFNDCPYITQYLFGQVADRRAQRINGGRRVKIENRLEVLIFKIGVRSQSAAGHETVGDADGQRLPEGHTQIQFIVVLQKAALGNIPDFTGVIVIILPRKLGRNVVKGSAQIVLHTVVGFCKYFHDGRVVLLPHPP